MTEINKRKHANKNAGKTVGSGVGVVPGDTIASALDPFGSAAGAIVRENLGNKAEKDTSMDDEEQGTESRNDN